jgi:hypothetical protein
MQTDLNAMYPERKQFEICSVEVKVIWNYLLIQKKCILEKTTICKTIFVSVVLYGCEARLSR